MLFLVWLYINEKFLYKTHQIQNTKLITSFTHLYFSHKMKYGFSQYDYIIDKWDLTVGQL